MTVSLHSYFYFFLFKITRTTVFQKIEPHSSPKRENLMIIDNNSIYPKSFGLVLLSLSMVRDYIIINKLVQSAYVPDTISLITNR